MREYIDKFEEALCYAQPDKKQEPLGSYLK